MNQISVSKLWQISQVLIVRYNGTLRNLRNQKREDDKRKESFHMKRKTLELVRNYVAAPADVLWEFSWSRQKHCKIGSLLTGFASKYRLIPRR
jgi:hypothetical protein